MNGTHPRASWAKAVQRALKMICKKRYSIHNLRLNFYSPLKTELNCYASSEKHLHCWSRENSESLPASQMLYSSSLSLKSLVNVMIFADFIFYIVSGVVSLKYMDSIVKIKWMTWKQIVIYSFVSTNQALQTIYSTSQTFGSTFPIT